MAVSVFGIPITDETLKGIPKYSKNDQITQKDRADVAFLMKNAENKDLNARQYLENVKEQRLLKDGSYTMCLIYNATGADLEFVKFRYWKGALRDTPYPLVIANGQWGAFFHGTWPNGDNESRAAVIYAGKNSSGKDCHFLLAWHCHNDRNKLYVETHDAGHYDDDATWGALDNLLSKNDLVYKEKYNGCYIMGSIGDTIGIAAFEGIITLTN